MTVGWRKRHVSVLVTVIYQVAMFVSETARRLLQSLAFETFVLATVGHHTGGVSTTGPDVVRLVGVCGDWVTSKLGGLFKDLRTSLVVD